MYFYSYVIQYRLWLQNPGCEAKIKKRRLRRRKIIIIQETEEHQRRKQTRRKLIKYKK